MAGSMCYFARLIILDPPQLTMALYTIKLGLTHEHVGYQEQFL